MKKMLLLILRLSLTIVVLVVAACETKPSLEIVEKNKEQIVSKDDLYDYVSYEKSVNCDDAILRFNDFNGTDTILNFYGGSKVTFIVTKSLLQGNIVFVMIDPYNQMTVLTDTTTFTTNQGQYRIKVVGEHASGMLSIQMNVIEQDPLSLFE